MLQLPKCNTNDYAYRYSYASQLGYFRDDYSKHFLKTKKKMFPIINRGTWARVYSFRQMIIRFLQAHKDQNINIISLGAGYDTTYFWLHDAIAYGEIKDVGNLKDKVSYIEIDFDDIVLRKIHTIKRTEELAKIVYPEGDAHEDANHINTPHYKLFAQDLRQTDEFRRRLDDLGVKADSPTLILTECLLVYMKSQDQKNILEALTHHFTGDIAILNYEMIHPDDAFGKVMIENLEVSVF